MLPGGLIERCSRADRAAEAAVAESWANGVSARKMERIARKMGIERLSKDQVSAMCRSLDAGVAELASRDLGEAGFPYLFLDAMYVKCRMDGRVQSTAVVTATGVGSDGVRRMPGVVAIDTETHAGWLGFLRGLRERGLSGARLVVSDAHAGLVRAIAECLPGVGWQRCVVHLERDVCSLLASRRHRAMAGKALQAVFRETDPATVRSAYRPAIDAVGAMSARSSRRPRPTSSPTWTTRDLRFIDPVVDYSNSISSLAISWISLITSRLSRLTTHPAPKEQSRANSSNRFRPCISLRVTTTQTRSGAAAEALVLLFRRSSIPQFGSS